MVVELSFLQNCDLLLNMLDKIDYYNYVAVHTLSSMFYNQHNHLCLTSRGHPKNIQTKCLIIKLKHLTLICLKWRKDFPGCLRECQNTTKKHFHLPKHNFISVVAKSRGTNSQSPNLHRRTFYGKDQYILFYCRLWYATILILACGMWSLTI